jgi:hypothetical protein
MTKDQIGKRGENPITAMNRSIAEFIGHRVSALAYVALTRRDDIAVMDIPGQGELDLLVRVIHPRDREARYFGVILKGTSRPLTDQDASKELNGYFRKNGKTRGSITFPFPVIALIFSMQSDEAFFDWRCQPRVLGHESPRMELRSTFECKRFTRNVLDGVVQDTNEWYDALFALLTEQSDVIQA